MDKQVQAKPLHKVVVQLIISIEGSFRGTSIKINFFKKLIFHKKNKK